MEIAIPIAIVFVVGTFCCAGLMFVDAACRQCTSYEQQITNAELKVHSEEICRLAHRLRRIEDKLGIKEGDD